MHFQTWACLPDHQFCFDKLAFKITEQGIKFPVVPSKNFNNWILHPKWHPAMYPYTVSKNAAMNPMIQVLKRTPDRGKKQIDVINPNHIVINQEYQQHSVWESWWFHSNPIKIHQAQVFDLRGWTQNRHKKQQRVSHVSKTKLSGKE